MVTRFRFPMRNELVEASSQQAWVYLQADLCELCSNEYAKLVQGKMLAKTVPPVRAGVAPAVGEVKVG